MIYFEDHPTNRQRIITGKGSPLYACYLDDIGGSSPLVTGQWVGFITPGGLTHLLFFHILGIISTDEIIFFRGVQAQPPSSNWTFHDSPIVSLINHPAVRGFPISGNPHRLSQQLAESSSGAYSLVFSVEEAPQSSIFASDSPMKIIQGLGLMCQLLGDWWNTKTAISVGDFGWCETLGHRNQPLSSISVGISIGTPFMFGSPPWLWKPLWEKRPWLGPCWT